MPAPKGNQYAKGKATGRPSSYRPEYAHIAEGMCRMGATNEELALRFRVSVDTISRWALAFDDFCGALKAGQDAADDRVERTLYQKAIGFTKEVVKPMMGKNGIELVRYTETVDPDVTAIIFWLKNRKPEQWRDVNRTEFAWTTKKLSELTNAELDQAFLSIQPLLALPPPDKAGGAGGAH
jgi:hypothetical protein